MVCRFPLQDYKVRNTLRHDMYLKLRLKVVPIEHGYTKQILVAYVYLVEDLAKIFV